MKFNEDARILNPLEMQHTLVNVAEERLADEVKGYRGVLRFGPLAIAIGSSRWMLPSHLAGAGGIRSTASDMHKFLKASVGLQASSITTAIEHSQQELFRRSESRSFGMGWINISLQAKALTLQIEINIRTALSAKLARSCITR